MPSTTDTSSDAPPPDAFEKRVGDTLRGKWKLERFVAAGGMAAVYVGVHTFGRREAIKILHPEYAKIAKFRARFEQEGHAVNRLDHPGVVKIRDIDVTDDGCPFLVMELLEGESLRQRANRLGGLSSDEVLRLTHELLDVLAIAHDHDVIHRDIKLDNLFVVGDGTLKVLDFGIARMKEHARKVGIHTTLGTRLGTISSMAPEQARGQIVDARTDLFAVGACMFRLITGRAIHHARGDAELMLKMATQPAPRLASVAPETPSSVGLVVDRALAFLAERRYPDARTMQRDVEALRSGTEPPHAARCLANGIEPDVVDALARDEPTIDTTGRKADASLVARVAPLIASDTSPSPETKTDPSSSLVGQVIGGRYHLEALIGRGGMGEVYRSVTPDGEVFALKVITGERLRSSETRRRFMREARASAGISSDHVVRVVDANTDERLAVPFIVMELLSGDDMSRWIRRLGALEPQVVVRLFQQACRGLVAAHRNDVIHRDIKPANLFLSRLDDGSEDVEVCVKVCDFGLATGGEQADSSAGLTITGSMLGTPAYASPEQALNAKKVDKRSDVWSLCMSMYEALAGRHAWVECETPGEVVVAICTQPVPALASLAPWVDPQLAAIVHRGLERDPENRFAGVDELGAALEQLSGGDDRVLLSDLNGVDEQARRSALQSEGKLAASGVSTSTKHPFAGGPKPRPNRWRSRAIAAGALALVASAALAIARAGSTDSMPRPEASAASVASAKDRPGPHGSASTSRTDPSPRELRARVAIFPKGASVRVDGVERTLDSGDLILEGEAEDSFVVEVQSGTGRVRERVKLLADGSASPTRVGHDVGVERRAAARARTQAGKTPTPEPPPATAGTSAVTASSGKPPSAPSGDVQFRRSWGD